MDKTSLTISLPRIMKEFIAAKVREGQFSTPSEYIRSLIREDQNQAETRTLEAFIRRGFRGRSIPELSEEDWSAVAETMLKRAQQKAQPGSRATTAGSGI